MYTTREKAFDGILISPTNPKHVFVFQYKSQFIKPEIKYTDKVEIERLITPRGLAIFQRVRDKVPELMNMSSLLTTSP
jgi:hypothetical protein